jgi:hypothetical protein
MQSFYKRFIRDYMRYRDEIQCLGHELVAAVRADARANGIASGDYYSLHIRRGDFQYKVMPRFDPYDRSVHYVDLYLCF